MVWLIGIPAGSTVISHFLALPWYVALSFVALFCLALVVLWKLFKPWIWTQEKGNLSLSQGNEEIEKPLPREAIAEYSEIRRPGVSFAPFAVSADVRALERLESRKELHALLQRQKERESKTNESLKPNVIYAKTDFPALLSDGKRAFNKVFNKTEKTWESITVAFRNEILSNQEIVNAKNVRARILYIKCQTKWLEHETDEAVWVGTNKATVNLKRADPSEIILGLVSHGTIIVFGNEYDEDGNRPLQSLIGFDVIDAYVCLTYGENQTQAKTFKFRITEDATHPGCEYLGETSLPKKVINDIGIPEYRENDKVTRDYTIIPLSPPQNSPVEFQDHTVSRLLIHDPLKSSQLRAIIAKFQAPLTNIHDVEVKAFLTLRNLDRPDEYFRHSGVWLNHRDAQKTLEIGDTIELILVFARYHELFLCESKTVQSDIPYAAIGAMKDGVGASVQNISVDVELVARYKDEVVFRHNYEVTKIKADIDYWQKHPQGY